MKGDISIIDARSDLAAAETARSWLYDEWGRRAYDDAEHRRRFEESVLAHEGPFPVCFIAIDAGTPVGAASLIEDDGLIAPFDAASGSSPWMAGVYVRPSARRTGVGSALVRNCLREARDLAPRFGWRAIWLYSGHPGALAMYARNGFVEAGTGRTARSENTYTVMRASLSNA